MRTTQKSSKSKLAAKLIDPSTSGAGAALPRSIDASASVTAPQPPFAFKLHVTLGAPGADLDPTWPQVANFLKVLGNLSYGTEITCVGRPPEAPADDHFYTAKIKEAGEMGPLTIIGDEPGSTEVPLEEAVKGEFELRLTLGATSVAPRPAWEKVRQFLEDRGHLSYRIELT